jgi:hypothetical protein
MLYLKIINASRAYIHQYHNLKKYLMVNYKIVQRYDLYLFIFWFIVSYSAISSFLDHPYLLHSIRNYIHHVFLS